MKHVSPNSHVFCPLHAYLAGNSGALPQDPALCPDCSGPDDEPKCCAMALLQRFSVSDNAWQEFLDECRRLFAVEQTDSELNG